MKLLLPHHNGMLTGIYTQPLVACIQLLTAALPLTGVYFAPAADSNKVSRC
jgi:hypothetical protein